MSHLGSESGSVQRPFVRYAVEVGWTYLSPTEALRLRAGGVASPVLDAVLVHPWRNSRCEPCKARPEGTSGKQYCRILLVPPTGATSNCFWDFEKEKSLESGRRGTKVFA